jgi:hypothetical protein
MHRAMRLRCLLRSPLWRVPAANPAAASSGGGASLARRLGAPPPRPFGENRRLCRFYSSKEGVGSAEAEAVGTGGGGSGSGSGSREQEHARLGERDQQEWLSGEGFLTGCKRRESPFLTKRDRFRKEFLRRAVPWDKTGISWNSFPYYVE